MSIFSDNLKRFRLLAGFSSMKALADAAGLVYNTYLSYETKDVEPKYEILCKLADLLHVSTDDLLGHNLGSPDPYLTKLRKAGAAAASAAAASLGMSLPTPEPDDLRFETLRKQMASIGFFITRNTTAPPDPKFGDRIEIVFDFAKKTYHAHDYYYRMYLLIPRLLQSAEHRAYETFFRQMLTRYGALERQPFNSYDMDSFDLSRYENRFENDIAPKTAKEIKAIVDGKADNPLIDIPPKG